MPGAAPGAASLTLFQASWYRSARGWWLMFDPTYRHINWALKYVWPISLLALGSYQWLGNEYLDLAVPLHVTVYHGYSATAHGP